MDIKLVSEDSDLYKLCREILAEIPGQRWTLSAVGAAEGEPSSDLYLWDFYPGISLPDQISENPAKHLFLVNRKDLPLLRKKIAADESHLLLKPVTKGTLTAFLGFAASAQAASSLSADRDEILQCLIQANLKLQEYDQDRTNFLARAVHDFRAPLTALSGYCGLLLGEHVGQLNENQKEVLRRMQHSARRLSRMASAMFQLSVGRQVRKRPDLQKRDLRECLDQALHEVNPFADEKQIEISADLAPSDYPLYFEGGQIEQLLVNILDNACKFTPKTGSIEIRGYPYFWERRMTRTASGHSPERRRNALADANAYRVDIRDSGAPIPPEYLGSIFEEYTSYHGGRDRSGGGLGLAICRMIIKQHDGHVWAENTEFGPMFSFVLPMYRVEPIQLENKNTVPYAEVV